MNSLSNKLHTNGQNDLHNILSRDLNTMFSNPTMDGLNQIYRTPIDQIFSNDNMFDRNNNDNNTQHTISKQFNKLKNETLNSSNVNNILSMKVIGSSNDPDFINNINNNFNNINNNLNNNGYKDINSNNFIKNTNTEEVATNANGVVVANVNANEVATNANGVVANANANGLEATNEIEAKEEKIKNILNQLENNNEIVLSSITLSPEIANELIEESNRNDNNNENNNENRNENTETNSIFSSSYNDMLENSKLNKAGIVIVIIIIAICIYIKKRI